MGMGMGMGITGHHRPDKTLTLENFQWTRQPFRHPLAHLALSLSRRPRVVGVARRSRGTVSRLRTCNTVSIFLADSRLVSTKVNPGYDE